VSDPDLRAREVEARMTDDERFSLLVGVMGAGEMWPPRDERIPRDVPMSAGYVPGVPRLGVPALRMSDAGLGVTNPGYRPGDNATALPAGLALAATFDPALARASGEVIGREARSRGFNVQLAGAMNLARDPRNGRNFEYFSEDPLLTATMAAESVNGIQQQGVISTVKHYSLNCNETNRHWLDAVIDPAAHRESDLLAFEIAIERSQPGAVMTAYNKVNGEYAAANDTLINRVLKGAWGYRGWVMSDWGGTPGWECALGGLDQESGAQIDVLLWGSEAFGDRLRAALAAGELPRERLSDMVRRILRSMFAVGIDDRAVLAAPDMAAHNEIALRIARQGIVLLTNRGALPLAPDPGSIAVIGGFAQLGVAAGYGSSAVVPPGGYASVIPIGGTGLEAGFRNLYLHPSSPLAELRNRFPHARVEFDPGVSPAEAVLAAQRADVAIVFAVRAEGEGFDGADLSLPWGQDALIGAVAAANPNTVVVLQTGNPVAMPWGESVNAIVQAWYPGQAGGRAIVEILAGQVNPSGRLPITFPAGLDQTPRPELPGLGAEWGTATTIDYAEGSEVGYRWFARTGQAPIFAFGHGLSYTDFEYRALVVGGGDGRITAAFDVVNVGDRAGADTPQLYLTAAAGGQCLRLLGFHRVELEPGASCRVSVEADPRLLARYDGAATSWRIAPGAYAVAVGASAAELRLTATVELAGRTFGR